jgi:hypothetical protein
MLFAKECMGAFQKDTPVKVNKWEVSKKLKNYNESVGRGWKSITSSKVKSTCWLLRSHALPVADRLGDRSVPATCIICGTKGVSHEHVFNQCPIAKEIWSIVNQMAWDNHCMEVSVDFLDALNPGKLPGYEGRVLDALAEITLHEIWLDYCNYSHKPSTPPPTQIVSNAILAHFGLNMASELSLLSEDLAWWARKSLFHPELEAKGDFEVLIKDLKARIAGISLIMKGEPAQQLQSLAPYSF